MLRARLSSCQERFGSAVFGVEPGFGPVRGGRVNPGGSVRRSPRSSTASQLGRLGETHAVPDDPPHRTPITRVPRPAASPPCGLPRLRPQSASRPRQPGAGPRRTADVTNPAITAEHFFAPSRLKTLAGAGNGTRRAQRAGRDRARGVTGRGGRARPGRCKVRATAARAALPCEQRRFTAAMPQQLLPFGTAPRRAERSRRRRGTDRSRSRGAVGTTRPPPRASWSLRPRRAVRNTGVVDNDQIADRLDAFATLLELNDANAYTTRAYRRAAAGIRGHRPRSPNCACGPRARAAGCRRWDRGTAARAAGDRPDRRLAELERELAPDLVGLGRYLGLTATRALELARALDVQTAEQFREAAADGRLRDVPGIGPKIEAQLLEALGREAEPRPRQGLLLDRALELVGGIAAGVGGGRRATSGAGATCASTLVVCGRRGADRRSTGSPRCPDRGAGRARASGARSG